MAGLLDFIGDDDDQMVASANAHPRQPLPGLLSGSGLLGASTMADIPRSGSTSWRNHVERAQVLPDNFEIEYTQQNLTPDEARARLSAANPKKFYGDSDTTSAVLGGNVTEIGDGGTVTNGQVLTVTRRGNIL